MTPLGMRKVYAHAAMSRLTGSESALMG